MKLNQTVSSLVGSAVETAKMLREAVQVTLEETWRNRSRQTNDRILAGLKSVGVAEEQEVQQLRDRLEKLEAELETLRAKPVRAPRAAAAPSPTVTN